MIARVWELLLCLFSVLIKIHTLGAPRFCLLLACYCITSFIKVQHAACDTESASTFLTNISQLARLIKVDPLRVLEGHEVIGDGAVRLLPSTVPHEAETDEKSESGCTMDTHRTRGVNIGSYILLFLWEW